jgi:hypothetical protein
VLTAGKLKLNSSTSLILRPGKKAELHFLGEPSPWKSSHPISPDIGVNRHPPMKLPLSIDDFNCRIPANIRSVTAPQPWR